MRDMTDEEVRQLNASMKRAHNSVSGVILEQLRDFRQQLADIQERLRGCGRGTCDTCYYDYLGQYAHPCIHCLPDKKHWHDKTGHTQPEGD